MNIRKNFYRLSAIIFVYLNYKFGYELKNKRITMNFIRNNC